MEKTYTEAELLKAIKLARLGQIEQDEFDFDVHEMKFQLGEEEILEAATKVKNVLSLSSENLSLGFQHFTNSEGMSIYIRQHKENEGKIVIIEFPQGETEAFIADDEFIFEEYAIKL